MAVYNYTSIRDLQAGSTKVNIIGVVAEFRAPTKSRGNDYSCCIELVDEGEKKLKCLIFNNDSALLPQSCARGDVVLLRRVGVKMFNQSLQAVCPRFGSWITCRKDSREIVPITCKDNFTFTAVEKERVRALREWAARSALCTGPGLAGAATVQRAAVVMPAVSLMQPPAFRNSHQMAFAVRHVPHFKKISSLKVGDTKISVCGVVKYFKPPMRSRGRDYYTSLTIVDDSSPDEGLNCVIFNPSQALLPPLKHTGEVVILKGLKINSYQTKLQGMGHERTQVAVFSCNPDDPLPDTITRLEKLRISAVRTWSSKENAWPANAKLDSVGLQHYFDVTCRVVAVYLDPATKTCVLTVFDGTNSKFNCKKLTANEVRATGCYFASDPPLAYAYSKFLHDVFIDGSSTFEADPGAYVRLIHVISEPMDDATSDGDNRVILKIKKDTFYGGGVVPLTEEKEIEDFSKALPQVTQSQPINRRPARLLPVSASVVYSDRPVSSLSEVYRGAKGEKFRCRVQVVVVETGHGIESLSQLRCTNCRKQFETPKADTANALSPGVGCRSCRDDSNKLQGVLKFVYVISLKVEDSTRRLLVYLNPNTSFFPQLKPANLYIDHQARDALLDRFYYMTGGNDPFQNAPRSHPRFNYPRPWLDCCIVVYQSKQGNKCFQLCDTVLCEWDLH